MKSDTGVMREAPTDKDYSSCQTALPMQNFPKGWGESASTFFSGTYGTAVAIPRGVQGFSILEVTGNTYSVQKGA